MDNLMFVQNVEKRQKYTAVLLDITDQYRTGMMENHRNSRIEKYTILQILTYSSNFSLMKIKKK